MLGRTPALRTARGWWLPVALAAALLPAGWDWSDTREAADRLAGQAANMTRQLRVPFEIARLQLRQPDATLAMPVAGARPAQVADTWLAARPGNRRHHGQDIFARRSTPVRSATEGYVVRVGENRLGGRVVSVLGAGGRLYYYAHLDGWAPGLAVGDRVSVGSVLGQVGTSGNARGTPPHLHFGVYTRSGPIDPLPLLRAGDG